MVELILKGFLFLVQTLYNIILAPILSGLIALFPDTANFFTYVTNFIINRAMTYVVVCRELILFPRTLMIIVLDYFIIKYTIHLILITVRFAINIYNKFKP